MESKEAKWQKWAKENGISQDIIDFMYASHKIKPITSIPKMPTPEEFENIQLELAAIAGFPEVKAILDKFK